MIDKILYWFYSNTGFCIGVCVFMIIITVCIGMDKPLLEKITPLDTKLNNIIERQDNIIDDLIYLRGQNKFLKKHLFTLQELTFKMAHGLISDHLCKECHDGKIGICEGCHGVKGVR